MKPELSKDIKSIISSVLKVLYLSFISAFPLLALHLPWWSIYVVVIFALIFPSLGSLALYILWIAAFVVQVQKPISTFGILFYILFAISVITATFTRIIPFISAERRLYRMNNSRATEKYILRMVKKLRKGGKRKKK